MTLYDQLWNRIDPPKDALGTFDVVEREIYHVYTVDVPGQWHEEIIREYPNGGRDVEIVWDVEEQGHWDTYDARTDELIPGFDNSYVEDNGASHDAIVQDIEYAELYRPLSKEEIDERNRLIEENNLRDQKQEEIDMVPDLVCALYEQTLSQQETIDRQEEILCVMYETMLEGGE